MAHSPMLGARCPVEWQQQIQAIANASGRKEAEVVREAIAQYLGQTDPATVYETIRKAYTDFLKAATCPPTF